MDTLEVGIIRYINPFQYFAGYTMKFTVSSNISGTAVFSFPFTWGVGAETESGTAFLGDYNVPSDQTISLTGAAPPTLVTVNSSSLLNTAAVSAYGSEGDPAYTAVTYSGGQIKVEYKFTAS